MSVLDSPKRVVVTDAAVTFVARGGRVFSRQILRSDPGLEDGDLVQVVDRRENILSTARFFVVP